MPRLKARPSDHVDVDVVTTVRQAGLHGLDLAPFKHLDDAQLLPLALLLNDSEVMSVQANALATLAQIGGTKSVDLVEAYIRKQPVNSRREVKEAAVVALAKNENPDVSARATQLVIKATRPSFWCEENAAQEQQRVCRRLAHMAIGGLAQSSQSLAKKYLRELAQSSEAQSAVSKAILPRQNAVSLIDLPVQTEIDAQWNTEANLLAKKFLSKANPNQ